ncbi:MAG: aldose epimerase family protein, partial [Bacteroidota bacterium]
MKLKFLTVLSLAVLAACSTMNDRKTSEGPASPQLFTLRNKNGMEATITNFGGKVVTLMVPDRNGKFADVVLGYDSASQYPGGNPYFGALIGRYGNRIANGQFTMGVDTFQLAKNNGPNGLHGGPGGFHNVLWEATPGTIEGSEALTLKYVSADREEGYPGQLTATVIYILTNDNELVIDYDAVTTKPTVVNLTHHSFFNLKGEGNGDILDHQFELTASTFLPVDSTLIPLGEPVSVAGTPFDFTSTHTAGERINADDQQLKFGKGYDHCWVLDKKFPGEFALAAKVTEPGSGRVMEVLTTEPGLQFYSGNFLTGKDIGKGGKAYGFRSAFCLEAQHFPDSPNKPAYPSVILKP